MNYSILDGLDIICYVILGVFCLKIDMKSSHFFILMTIITAMKILSLLSGYNLVANFV